MYYVLICIKTQKLFISFYHILYFIFIIKFFYENTKILGNLTHLDLIKYVIKYVISNMLYKI